MSGTRAASTQERFETRRIAWQDIAQLRSRLEPHGITEAGFASHIERIRRDNDRRVREGDLDHLVFYLLQSTRFTGQPAIEPALSAKALVEGLDFSERGAFLRTGTTRRSHVPPAVQARAAALVTALDSSSSDPRLAYFRELVGVTVPEKRERKARLLDEYLRVMQFVYEKEFVAQPSAGGAEAVAALYRTRGFSTDTAVEAGFLVYHGLGVVKSLEPVRRVRRVLIIGPGLDLAPGTALLESGAPESYQPWAVIDALLALGLARGDDLDVVAADINPRVVQHLRRSRASPPTLTLVSEIAGSERVTLTESFRDYFAQLGRAIGRVATVDEIENGHLRKSLQVGAEASRALRAERLDIVTERLEGPAFDLILATNVLPYFDDPALILAIANGAAMLAPGGVFLHNEARPLLRDVSAEVGLLFEQSRHVTIANVRGAPTPLYDSVWIHRKTR